MRTCPLRISFATSLILLAGCTTTDDQVTKPDNGDNPGAWREYDPCVINTLESLSFTDTDKKKKALEFGAQIPGKGGASGSFEDSAESVLIDVRQYTKDTLQQQSAAMLQIANCLQKRADAYMATPGFKALSAGEQAAFAKKAHDDVAAYTKSAGEVFATPSSITVTGSIAPGNQQTKMLRQDCEVHSDDWTGVHIRYNVTIGDDKRSLFLNATWDTLELEKSKEHKKTHLRTTDSAKIYQLPPEWPRWRIKSIDAGGSGELRHDFFGELHTPQPFPAFASLREIRVKFDDSGSNDCDDQLLWATCDVKVTLELVR